MFGRLLDEAVTFQLKKQHTSASHSRFNVNRTHAVTSSTYCKTASSTSASIRVKVEGKLKSCMVHCL